VISKDDWPVATANTFMPISLLEGFFVCLEESAISVLKEINQEEKNHKWNSGKATPNP
jgi:hypothetical protein